MISVIVFSKDRALQLDLLLQSIKKNCDFVSDIKVIYKTSSEAHEKSYKQLKFEHRAEATFVDQASDCSRESIFYCAYEACCLAQSKYICFLTDDDIVYQNIEEKDINDALFLFKDSAFSCFSLRLGFNTCERQVGAETIHSFPYHAQFLKPEANDSIVLWDRTTVPFGDYWSYFLSVDGHIFRKDDIRQMSYLLHEWSQIEKFGNTPNTFESKLQRFNYEYGPYMGCFTTSRVVNSPNNRVQNEAQNRSGDVYNYSSEYLNQLFLDGKRLSLEAIDFDHIKSPHTELKLF
jgi:hypothetical protein